MIRSLTRLAVAAVAVLSPALALAADPAAPAPETPNIHGFVNVPFKTAYITPRGLVVENQGLVIQPIGGLVIPIDSTFTVIGGVWNSINTHQDDPSVGAYNEIDPFITLDAKLGDFDLSATYVAFISPAGNFETEHNAEFALKYSDKWFKDFAINPYAKFFWAISGDSTVVTGRKGDTFDVELGVAPSYTFLKETEYPITVTVPTFITVGPENFWGGDQNFGVFNTSVNFTVPLSFIPAKYGHWHAGVGVSYYYLINDELVNAADILGCNRDRNRLVGSCEIGFNF